MAVTGLVLAGIVTLALVKVVDHREQATAPAAGQGIGAAIPAQPASTGARAEVAPIDVVSVDPSGALVEHDLAGSTSRVLAPDAAGWPEGPANVSGQILYLSGGVVYEVGRAEAIYPGPAGAPQVGEPEGLVPVNGPHASVDFGQVWVQIGADGADSGQAVLLDQDGDQWRATQSLRLAAGERPVAAVPGMLITADGVGRVRERDASTGAIRLATDGLGGPQASADVVGAADGFIAFVACATAPDCPLVVQSPRGQQMIRPPAGSSQFIAGGSVSVEGWIAAFAATGTPEDPGAELVLVNGVTGATRVVSVPIAIGDPVGAAAWGLNGDASWLVFGGTRETYVLDTDTMRPILLTFAAGYGFTTAQCC